MEGEGYMEGKHIWRGSISGGVMEGWGDRGEGYWRGDGGGYLEG